MKLPDDQMKIASEYLKNHYAQEDLIAFYKERKAYYAHHPDAGCENWFLPHHFTEGIAIRNCLRAAIPETDLPDDDTYGWPMVTSWDDYYIAVINAVLDELN